MTTQLTDPEHIAISKSKGIEIDWKDGHHSSYGVEYLRDWCPCATCAGSHGTTPGPQRPPAGAEADVSPGKSRQSVPDVYPQTTNGRDRAGGQLRAAHRLERW